MVDVIIPVFNSRKTIEKTIMSLVIQRLAKRLWITIVDDGSTDGYDYNELASKYRRFFDGFDVITLPENHGVGYARQVAIRSTRNPWIYFIDSDDLMTQCYAFNRLIGPAVRHPNVSMVFANCTQEAEPSEGVIGFDYEQMTYTDHKENLQYFHGKLYSRAFIMQNGITVAPTRSNEDIAFNMAFFTLADPGSIIHINFSTVVTICNKESITRNKKSTRVYTNTNVNENMDAYNACLHAFKEVKIKLGGKLSPDTAKHFIEKYVNLFSKGMLGEFESADDRKLYQMINTLFYRDIIKPILNANGIQRKLDNSVVCNNPFNYWSNETYENHPLPDIYTWSENALKEFNQETFDELAQNKLTEVGYIG